MLSGKRDSDPRPQPWQGCALPTELFPHLLRFTKASLSIADAKVMLFSELANFLGVFFQKNLLIHSISVILIVKLPQYLQLSIAMQHTYRGMTDAIEHVRLHRRVMYHVFQPYLLTNL